MVVPPPTAVAAPSHAHARTDVAGATGADTDRYKIGGLMGVHGLTIFDFNHQRVVVIGVLNVGFPPEREVLKAGKRVITPLPGPYLSDWLIKAIREGRGDDGNRPCLMIVNALENRKVIKDEPLAAHIKLPRRPEADVIYNTFMACDETTCHTDDVNYIDLWFERIVEVIKGRTSQSKYKVLPFMMRTEIPDVPIDFFVPTSTPEIIDYILAVRNTMFFMVISGDRRYDEEEPDKFHEDYRRMMIHWQNLDKLTAIEMNNDIIFRNAYCGMINDIVDEHDMNDLVITVVTPILNDINVRLHLNLKSEKKTRIEELDPRVYVRRFMVAMWMKAICYRGPLEFPVGCRKPWAKTKDETIVCLVPGDEFHAVRQMFDKNAISFDIVRTQLKKDGLILPKPMDLLGRS